MVQRKLSLCINPENRSGIFKSSLQLQDYLKTRGPDSPKMKMKRTRSKRLRDTVSHQPGKPPTLHDHAEVAAKTPPQKLKQVFGKVTEGSPNYMKGTSSSEARRSESSRNVRVSSDSKILHRTNETGTKLCSGSISGSGIGKQSRGLCRTSSLMIARALKKTSSFKKCSRVNHVERATCSSTLKDTKFPEYLMLNPGGTEAEGTSLLKVCPYTYCSLNGHLHSQYPPLKSFISARRRALKAQRSMKMEASSPRAEKPTNLAGEEIVDSSDQEPVSSIIQEMEDDGFVEIYVGKKKEYDEGNECTVTDFSGEPKKQNGFSFEYNSQVSESISDGAPRSEIDSEENFGCCNAVFSMEIEPDESSAAEEVEKEYLPLSLQDDAKDTEEIDSEGLSEYEVTVVEREEEGSFSTKDEDKSDYSERSDADSESEDHSLGSSEAYGSEIEETLFDNDAADDLIGKGNINSYAGSNHSEFEIIGMLQKPGILEQSENPDLDSSDSKNDVTEMTAEEGQGRDTEAGLVSISINFLWVEEPTGESKVANEMVQAHKPAEVDNNGHELNVVDSLTSGDTADAGDEGTSKSGKHIVNQNLLEDAKENGQSGQQENEAEDNGEQDRHKTCGIGPSENNFEEINEMEIELESESATEEAYTSPEDQNIQGDQTPKGGFTRAGKSCNQDEPNDVCNKWMIKRRRSIEDTEDTIRAFNPREPNYLPIVVEPDGEKVDLKHQDVDERKNAEEWMIDYALQRTVNKLAPERKRKVALLVEAFETVMPDMHVSKCQTHFRESSTGFTHGRPLQACN